jgi:hypothetical protein
LSLLVGKGGGGIGECCLICCQLCLLIRQRSGIVSVAGSGLRL